MDIDDLVDGLPTRHDPLGRRPPLGSLLPPAPKQKRPAPKKKPPPSRTPSPAQPPAPATERITWKFYRIPRWLFYTMVISIIGFVWADVLGHGETAPYQSTPDHPAETVTVTVTKTVTVVDPQLPESCRKVIVLMRDLLTDMSNLNSKSQAQLDIASQANIAIFQKDWAKLREVQERQRELVGKQQGAYQDFKSKYQPALDAMTQCEKDGNK